MHGKREGPQPADYPDTDVRWEVLFLFTRHLHQGELQLDMLLELCLCLDLILGALHRRGLRGLEDKCDGLSIQLWSIDPGSGLDVILGLV